MIIVIQILDCGLDPVDCHPIYLSVDFFLFETKHTQQSSQKELTLRFKHL